MAVCPADAAAAASNKTKKEAGQRPLACYPALSLGAVAVDPSSGHPRLPTQHQSRPPARCRMNPSPAGGLVSIRKKRILQRNNHGLHSSFIRLHGRFRSIASSAV